MAKPAKLARDSWEKKGSPGVARRTAPILVTRAERRRVIAASSVGTIFEWYDFYLYAVLAPFFAKLFFPPGNETAALLAAFATYAAGFLVRPFGAIVFGRLGDLTGRKFTFLISIIFMGFSTFTVGLLPTFEHLGWLAPILLVTLRLLQGLALGGSMAGRRPMSRNIILHDAAATQQAGSKRLQRPASSLR
jgi:MFS family permease